MNDDAQRFTMLMVPPNLTGDLHLGHALMLAVQDCLIRAQRQHGARTTYIPGFDHAGLGTYAAVMADRSFRPDLPMPDRLVAWATHWRTHARSQMQRLNLSCSWDREMYTLDSAYKQVVERAFGRLAQDGLIYRALRAIRWCPRCRTTISDIECTEVPVNSHVARVAVVVGSTHLVLNVTEPEFLWGAVALAMASPPAHEAWTPMGPLPVIAVDGDETAPMLVVPAHDQESLAIARLRALPIRAVLDEDGRSLVSGAEGLQRNALRTWTIRTLQLHTSLAPTPQRRCGRCEQVTFPRCTMQWFLRMASLAAPLLDALREGEVSVCPRKYRLVAEGWLEQIEDWCISRQVAWGPRIPAWRCEKCDVWSLAQSEVCTGCGSRTAEEVDVFDTWFASSLWPLGSVGWPLSPDFGELYPVSIITTGKDILFFWLLRTLMLCYRVAGELPTRVCFLHGLVLDPTGLKMSKSKGNTTSIASACDQYGADVVRAGLLARARGARDIRADPSMFVRHMHVRRLLEEFANADADVDGTADDGLTAWLRMEVNAATRLADVSLGEFDFSGAVARFCTVAESCVTRFLQIRRRQYAELGRNRIAISAAAASDLARLAEPVMPELAASLRARGAVEGGPSEDETDEVAIASQQWLSAIAELEWLRGSAGINTAMPVYIGLPTGTARTIKGEPWLPYSTHLPLERTEAAPADHVVWRVIATADEFELNLPVHYAPRLHDVARRRLREEGRRGARLRRHLEELARRTGGVYPAEEAVHDLSVETNRRLDLLRRNVESARTA